MGDFVDQAWKWHLSHYSQNISQKSVRWSYLTTKEAGKYSLAVSLGRRGNGFDK